VPSELLNLINAGETDGGTARSYFQSGANALYYAGDSIAAQNWAAAKSNLYSAAENLIFCNKYLLEDDAYYSGLRGDWYDALIWINNNWPSTPPTYELTWQKIIEALTYNEYECAVAMTLVFDKIRKVAWNKPFLLAHALNPELYL
jgi:hypothetical protein